ncbi:MAG: transcriptional repressor [Boseongicola sp. SB0662_bin_57]|nr:transcriptional repressor [Boseongicola sp. SB0662_bin_57]
MPQERTRMTHAERVLEFLRRKGRPLSAYEILEALRGDGVTAATTVYRALAKLPEAGHVHRIESLNAWIACREPHHVETPVFEICDGCSNVTEHVASHPARDIAALSTDSGFAPDHSVIEIHDRCNNCGPTVQST